MARSRRTLEQYFDRTTARILDALVEGLSIHRALDKVEQCPVPVIAVLHGAVIGLGKANAAS